MKLWGIEDVNGRDRARNVVLCLKHNSLEKVGMAYKKLFLSKAVTSKCDVGELPESEVFMTQFL